MQRQEWQEYYYKNELFRANDLDSPPSYYKPGFALISTLVGGQKIYQAAKAFDIDHAIVFINPAQEFCEFFYFATQSTNYKIVNFYLNQIDLLQRFNNHFKQVAGHLIQKGEEQRIILPPDHIPQNQSPNELWHFNQKATSPSLQNNDTDAPQWMRLTARERECCQYLAQGMTSKHIGRELDISYRTIEKYVGNIKSKLLCANKSELIALLAKYIPSY